MYADPNLVKATKLIRGHTVLVGGRAPGIALEFDHSWDHFSGRYGTISSSDDSDAEMMSSWPRSPANKDVLAGNLNAIPGLSRIYEDTLATAFYTCAGVITCVWMCCGHCCFDLLDEEHRHDRDYVAPTYCAHVYVVITVGFKIFDLMSDWAVFAIAMHSPRLTVSSSIGELNGGGHEALKWTSLFFCILGTLTWVPDHFFTVNQSRTAAWALCVICAEDLP